MVAGANAVILLTRDFSGVTVTGFSENTAWYMDIKEAIKQRQVNLDEVSIFEQLGFCFGRVRVDQDTGAGELSCAAPRHRATLSSR